MSKMTVAFWLAVVVFIFSTKQPLYGKHLELKGEQYHFAIRDFGSVEINDEEKDKEKYSEYKEENIRNKEDEDEEKGKEEKSKKSAKKAENKRKLWPLENVRRWNTPIQSPVDLITTKAKNMSDDLSLLEIINHDVEGINATVYNSGSTVFVYINEEPQKRPCLIGGPLRYKFVFEQMHFHWGSDNIWGSEHFIDGESFSVEIHMVYYNHYKYKEFTTAIEKTDGIAALTVFAEATLDMDDELLNPLYEQLPKITKAGSKTALKSKLAMQWVRNAMETNTEYYAYPGSMTSPPYTENVLYILLPKPIVLSKAQLQAFRTMLKAHHDNTTGTDFNEKILNNKRKLQPLYGRPIIMSNKVN